MTRHIFIRNFDLSKWERSAEKALLSFLPTCMGIWFLLQLGLCCLWLTCSSAKLKLSVWVRGPGSLAKHLEVVRGLSEMKLLRSSGFCQVFCLQDLICILGWAARMRVTLDLTTSRFSNTCNPTPISGLVAGLWLLLPPSRLGSSFEVRSTGSFTWEWKPWTLGSHTPFWFKQSF